MIFTYTFIASTLAAPLPYQFGFHEWQPQRLSIFSSNIFVFHTCFCVDSDSEICWEKNVRTKNNDVTYYIVCMTWIRCGKCKKNGKKVQKTTHIMFVMDILCSMATCYTYSISTTDKILYSIERGFYWIYSLFRHLLPMFYCFIHRWMDANELRCNASAST